MEIFENLSLLSFKNSVWSFYKVLELFTLDHKDNTFDPKTFTNVDIELASKRIPKDMDEDTKNLLSLAINTLKNEESRAKYIKEELVKLEKQKKEVERILKLNEKYQSGPNVDHFFEDLREIAFYQFKILGFCTTDGDKENNLPSQDTFDWTSITNEQFKARFYEKRNFLLFNGNPEVNMILEDSLKFVESPYWSKINSASVLFQKPLWEDVDLNVSKVVEHSEKNIYLDMYLLIKNFSILFFKVAKKVYSSKPKVDRKDDKFFSLLLLFISIYSYYHSRCFFMVPLEDFFTLKFSVFSTFILMIFLENFEGLFVIAVGYFFSQFLGVLFFYFLFSYFIIPYFYGYCWIIILMIQTIFFVVLKLKDFKPRKLQENTIKRMEFIGLLFQIIFCFLGVFGILKDFYFLYYATHVVSFIISLESMSEKTDFYYILQSILFAFHLQFYFLVSNLMNYLNGMKFWYWSLTSFPILALIVAYGYKDKNKIDLSVGIGLFILSLLTDFSIGRILAQPVFYFLLVLETMHL
jgi:hypothetical protein